MDVLSDTMGVDFGPYLARVLHDVRENWYRIIPESARAPLMKKGKVSIEFAILKNGQVAGLQIVGTSGDVALDRAAYGGITASKPFPPLPTEFGGQYLALRFHFYYNPDKIGSAVERQSSVVGLQSSAKASEAKDLLKTDDRRLTTASHQTLHLFSRTIAEPGLQWNACWNSGMLETTPLARYLSGECGSMVAYMRLVSSRVCEHQLCPYPMKKRCSGVKPSIDSSFWPRV